VLFLLTGSAGSGKSTALRELSARRGNLAVFDFDDLRPPPGASHSWWQQQIDDRVASAVTEQSLGRETMLAGWLTLGDVHAAPLAGGLAGVAACLLDCTDDVRLARIEQRAASGTWRQHTPEEVAGYIRAAARMRDTAAGMFRLDTSRLTPDAVATRLENWMAHAQPGH
jgi:cytidylate kinase